jgi:putative acetyltransferase
MIVREATAVDKAAVLEVHARAFGQDDERLLVDALLADPSAEPHLSLLAEDRGRVVGHALFTSVRLVGLDDPPAASILAPLAVIPSAQGSGIGRQLIERGCELLAQRGVKLVFVLGDPGYYSKRGFAPALLHGLHAPYEIHPEDAWMVRALDCATLGSAEGRVSCADALAPQKYWRE